jgi:hypothetical protein
MIEVRRPSDGELCGHVRSADGAWLALTVFGGLLAAHPERESAEEHVRTSGLASLAQRWWYRPEQSAEWQVVCIQEANPNSLRIALDYYSMPGVPTVTVTRQQLESGATLALQPEG